MRIWKIDDVHFDKVGNQSKYGTIIKGFVSQFSFGNNQYLMTTTPAADVLSNHRLDPKFYENKRDKRSRENSRNDTKEDKNNATSFSYKDATWYCLR